MTTVVGILIVFGSIIGGFLMHHGNLHVLFQPSEFIIIGGAGPGSLIVMVPPKLFKKVIAAVPTVFKAPSQTKEGSLEVLGLLYEVFAKIKRDGALAIEKDVEEPTESEIFQKYPSFLENHAAVSPLCDTLRLSYPVWIEGHTDAHPFRKGSYTNWELSVDRANVVRKELAASGIPEGRIMKVIGYAATDPIVRDQPYSPLNRRVSIVVKEKKDTEIDVNPARQPSVASESGEALSTSNAAESLSVPSESGEASDQGTTDIVHRAQSSRGTLRAAAH